MKSEILKSKNFVCTLMSKKQNHPYTYIHTYIQKIENLTEFKSSSTLSRVVLSMPCCMPESAGLSNALGKTSSSIVNNRGST